MKKRIKTEIITYLEYSQKSVAKVLKHGKQ